MMFDSYGSCMFLGEYNPAKAYSVGDICILDGETVVFDGMGFEPIGQSLSEQKEPEEPKQIVYGTCKYCGAPLKDAVCEYCGVKNKIE